MIYSKEEYKKTFLLAYPISLTYLGHILTGLVDNIMVGQIGADKLAASSLANNVTVLPMVFGLGLSYGLTPLIANAHGENNNEKINSLQQSALFINFAFGLLIFLFLFNASWIFQYLDQDQLIVEMAIPYTQILALSMIPYMIFQNHKQFADGLSLTKVSMYIGIGSNVVNVILNYGMIFGKMGFPEYGLMGASYATLIARALMAIGMILAIKYLKRFSSFDLQIIGRNIWNTDNFKRYLNLGIPSGLQMFFEVGAFSISAIMVGWLGYKYLAAHQIAISLASATYVIAAGFGIASTIRVGRQMGAREYEKVKTVGNVGLQMAAVFMTICGLLFVLLNQFLPTLYVDDPMVLEIASRLIIISAAFQIFDGVQVTALGALRGLSDVKWPTIIAAVAYWVFGLPFSYIMAFPLNLGVDGIWYGFILGLGIAAVALSLRFRSRKFD